MEELDLEMLSESFLDQLEGMEEILEEISEGISGYGDIEDETEHDGVYGDNKDKEELKEYLQKMKKYAERIKEDIKEIYGNQKKEITDRDRTEPKMKSPWERGHKIGCGCPGCSAFREFHGLKSGTEKDQHAEVDLKFAGNKSDPKANEYVEKTDSRPCGGKHYHHFHGNMAGLRKISSYVDGLNFGAMGY